MSKDSNEISDNEINLTRTASLQSKESSIFMVKPKLNSANILMGVNPQEIQNKYLTE